MDSKAYKKGVRVGKFLDFVEYITIPILYRNTRGLKIVESVKYGDEHREELDIIFKDDGTKKPILIYIHGGGFISGVRKMRKYICAEYARAGYKVFNLDYELAPCKQFPYQIYQLAKAFEYITKNADEYNVDLTNIVIAGESAGAYYACYLTALLTNQELQQQLGIKVNLDSINIKATVLMNGCYSAKGMCKLTFPNMPTFIESFFGADIPTIESKNDDEIALLSATNFIIPAFPKTVVGRSKKDGLDPESVHLIEVLKANNVPYTEFMAGGINSPHGWCLATFTKEGKRCLNIAQEYIK